MKCLWNYVHGKTIGITGSTGSKITAKLIYHILKENNNDCYLVELETSSILHKVHQMTEESIIILEFNSIQLLGIQTSPDISIITNLSENNYEQHQDFEEYMLSNKNMLNFQNKNGILILNYENNLTRYMGAEANGRVIYYSKNTKLENGIIYDNGIIKSCEDGVRRHVMTIDDAVSLRGLHNYENICAAIAATSSLVEPSVQSRAVTKFKGVEHRLELVRSVNRVKWYNDSIGTSPSRTIAGLNAFDEKIVLIAGGYDKHLDYNPIAKPIVDNVSSLVLVGATADKIEEAVRNQLKADKKDMPIYRCSTLEECVIKAHEIVKEDEIVLFSPASASFDMYKNFMERGQHFKDLVNKI